MSEKKTTISQNLNNIRAAVLGSNDGILGASGVLFGIIGATFDSKTLLVAGVAEMLAVAFSMSSGEFVSVSSQHDAEVAAIKQEEKLLKTSPETEYKYLVNTFIEKGLDEKTATEFVNSISKESKLHLLVKTKYNIEASEYLNPKSAALYSLIASILGAMLPILSAIFLPVKIRIYGVIAGTLIALFLVGYLGAKLSDKKMSTIQPILRNVLWGIITMVVTFLLGRAM
jgi:VIT1/CCC1 family predicted Fe2+/Mn2+ transporter